MVPVPPQPDWACERLFAEHRALREHVELRAAARQKTMCEAVDTQARAHLAEDRAFKAWEAAADASLAYPTDLRLVAAADRAEAAYQSARTVADIASRQANIILARALAESQRDTEQLRALEHRACAAQAAELIGEHPDPG